ncbi:MAG: NPCBM/NEW2 domain-containing protein, partial [Micromonosporaceae bacterium]|nr:NPCBM/NEW2 domain-containing protein [Micromonosporaceae bacterium]
TVKPGADNTVTTTFSNAGRLPATAVAVALSAPAGWTVTPDTAPIGPAVPTGGSFRTQWTVRPSTATVPGTYTLSATGMFSWAGQHWGTVLGTVTVLIATRVPAGTHYLSDVAWMSASNYWGPVEKDRSNGEQGADDGHTMTIGGVTYAKGLGAHAPGEIDYYTGGGCTTVQTDVGIDDEKTGDGDVTFQIWADDRLVAQARATWQDAPMHLTADVTGAQVVRLVLDPDGSPNNDHSDWAGAQIVC